MNKSILSISHNEGQGSTPSGGGGEERAVASSFLSSVGVRSSGTANINFLIVH